VSDDGRRLDNGQLTVTIADDGTLRLQTARGVVADGVGRIVDSGDFGDSYNHAPPTRDSLVDEPTSVSVDAALRGPVRGRVVVSRTYAWPVRVEPDGGARSSETRATRVDTIVELRAGEPFVRIGVAFENGSDDHRVRFHVPLPRRAEHSHAEGQFAVVQRSMRPEGGYREEPLPTFPAHGWVDAGGMAVLLEHLTEYELTDGGSELAITVLRSIGLISRNDNPYRLDPAGPEIAIPNAQMHGPMRMAFALYPHDGDWTDGGVVDAAERYRHSFLAWPGASVAAADGPWPPEGADEDGLRLDGSDVVLTSLRRRDHEWLEARIVNLAPAPRRATVTGGLTAAREADLLGTSGSPLTLDPDGSLALDLGPAEIRTVQLRRRQAAAARPEMLDAAGPRQSA
jgi:alpha-mannosidase